MVRRCLALEAKICMMLMSPFDPLADCLQPPLSLMAKPAMRAAGRRVRDSTCVKMSRKERQRSMYMSMPCCASLAL